MMKRILLAAWLLVLPTMAALAQSQPPSPGGTWPGGFVPTPGQWQAAWAAKMDFNGVAACPVSGCTLTGKLTLAPSTSSNAGLNCGQGLAPASPINGDFWCTSSGIFAFINGGVVTLGGSGGVVTVPGGGTGQVSFTANLPLLGNGTGNLGQGTRSGNTTTFATSTGTLTSGHCVSIDGSGNFIDAGGACTTGGGGGTVSSATGNQLAVYATSGTVVSGLATCNSGYYGTNGSGVPSCATTLSATLQGNITVVGLLASGALGTGFTVVSPALGGTGVNNGTSLITVGGNFSVAGAFTLALTVTGNTAVTFPASGNIPNSSGNSGGVPYYNTSTTIATSAVLTANLPVFGGGAGAAPFSGTRSGSTTEVGTVSGSLTSGNGLKADASGNIVDFGSVPASLSVSDQTLSGGANVTPFSIGTVTSGTTTVDCGKSPLQTMTNNGASTIAAPANDGSCIVYMLNGASAGAISFSGFTVSSNTGDALNTTNTNKFFISVVRAGGVSNYVVRSLQ